MTIENEQLVKLGGGNAAYLQFNTLLVSRSDFASCLTELSIARNCWTSVGEDRRGRTAFQTMTVRSLRSNQPTFDRTINDSCVAGKGSFLADCRSLPMPHL